MKGAILRIIICQSLAMALIAFYLISIYPDQIEARDRIATHLAHREMLSSLREQEVDIPQVIIEKYEHLDKGVFVGYSLGHSMSKLMIWWPAALFQLIAIFQVTLLYHKHRAHNALEKRPEPSES